MSTTGIVSQSNFVPWRGYFAALRLSTQLVIYDSQQFTRRDWRNRNLIAGEAGQRWLTIPVKSRGNYLSPINKIEVCDSAALETVIRQFRSSYRHYSKTAGFEFVEQIFSECSHLKSLSEINLNLTRSIAQYLRIQLDISTDKDLNLFGGKNDKLIQVCKSFNIDVYLTGPSAKSYLDEGQFKANNILVDYLDYSSLPPNDLGWEPSIIHWIITKEFDELIKLTSFGVLS